MVVCILKVPVPSIQQEADTLTENFTFALSWNFVKKFCCVDAVTQMWPAVMFLLLAQMFQMFLLLFHMFATATATA